MTNATMNALAAMERAMTEEAIVQRLAKNAGKVNPYANENAEAKRLANELALGKTKKAKAEALRKASASLHAYLGSPNMNYKFTYQHKNAQGETKTQNVEGRKLPDGTFEGIIARFPLKTVATETQYASIEAAANVVRTRLIAMAEIVQTQGVDNVSVDAMLKGVMGENGAYDRQGSLHEAVKAFANAFANGKHKYNFSADVVGKMAWDIFRTSWKDAWKTLDIEAIKVTTLMNSMVTRINNALVIGKGQGRTTDIPENLVKATNA